MSGTWKYAYPGPRWRKTLRDLSRHKLRSALVVLAMAIGVFGVTAVLGAYSILSREIPRNLQVTHPASAILRVEGLDDALVVRVAGMSGIAAAEAGNQAQGRAEASKEDWVPIQLFVVRDFGDLRINRFFPERGSFDPSADEVLIERSSLGVIGRDIGDSVVVRTTGNGPQSLVISGVVHDPGQAPGWMEGAAYGYIGVAAAERLGLTPALDELRIRIPGPSTRRENRTIAGRVRRAIEEWGSVVRRVQVPEPGRHPHQDQMMSTLFLLQAFGWLALFLAAILVATVMAAVMAHELRQIGVMKTLGARRRQIVGPYFGGVLVLAGMGLALGMPTGLWVGRLYARSRTDILNFEIDNYSVDFWVWALLIGGVGLLALAAAAIPILRAGRVTVVEAIRRDAAGAEGFGQRRLDRFLGRFSRLGRLPTLALRNSFRQPRRLLLTLLTLSTGGALVMVALNLGASWDRISDRLVEPRKHDLAITLDRLYPVARFASVLHRVPGLRAGELWTMTSASLVLSDGTNEDRFSVAGVPAATRMIDYPILSGRWLLPDDRNALVVSHMLAAGHPRFQVGRTVRLEIGGRDRDWVIVGVAQAVFDAGAFANLPYLSEVKGSRDLSNHVRLVLAPAASGEGRPQATGHFASVLRAHGLPVPASGSAEDASRGPRSVLRKLEGAFQTEGMEVTSSRTTDGLRRGLQAHVVIIVGLVMIMTALSVAVGGLGLASALALNVVERRREIAVMRAIGAPKRAIRRLVLGEGVVMGIFSWLAAVLLSVPLTALLARQSGRIFLKVPLAIDFSMGGMALWLAVTVVLSLLAGLIPARQATRPPVQEVLGWD